MASDVCPKCKFPISDSAPECRLCGDPLPPRKVQPEEEPAPDGGKTSVWSRDHLPGLTGLAAVQAFFDDDERSFAPEPETSPATRPRRPAPEDVLAWISCPPLAPIPLPTDMTELSVGRVSGNDLMLPHHAVSRKHCALRRDGTYLTFTDLSSNGSFLNGKRVESARVRVGDVLTVGPYDLELVADYPDEEDGAHTSEFDFASVTSGLIEGASLAEMLQGLEFNRKTGTLKILAGRLRGMLVLRDGQAQFASFGDQHDESAVLDMLDLAYGRYTFFGTPESGQRSMTKTLTAILFEHSRRADESDH